MEQVMDQGSKAVDDRNIGQAFRDLPDEEIEALVQSLNSLHEGELGIDMLVACGERAIGPLRRFLLHGKPSGIFAPKQRAVKALAELGAKQVLLDYLEFDEPIADPVAAHGEEAVKNTAARALVAWHTEDVYQALLQALRRRRLHGVIEALGEFPGRAEAVPELVAALEDDFCRSSAEDVLRNLGEAAHFAFIDAARTPNPSSARETPSSRSRRRSVLRLLESLRLLAGDGRKIAALLQDSDPEIAARAGAIALSLADRPNQELAVERMIEVLPAAGWFLQAEIQEWLEKHLDVALPSINEEIRRRQSASPAVQAADSVLRLLLAVKRKGKNPAAAAH
jgi:hypothetical protein